MPAAILERAVDVAHAAADAAREITLGGFRTAHMRVEHKADASPVTAFDRRAEAAMRAIIAQAFPDHEVLGEEQGTSGGERGATQSRWRWVLDPIDGTKSFTMGIPLYGTIVALQDRGEAVIALEDVPALDERFVAVVGDGTRCGTTPARVSNTRDLQSAVIALGDAGQFKAANMTQAFSAVHDAVRLARTYPDVYGHSLVYAGHIDAMVDPALKPWDIAAARLLTLEAGGAVAERPSQQAGATDLIIGTLAVVDELLAWLSSEDIDAPRGSTRGSTRGPTRGGSTRGHPWHLHLPASPATPRQPVS